MGQSLALGPICPYGGPTPPAGKDSELSDTTELSQAIAALLSQEGFGGLNFEVELRESFAPPAASRPVAIAILWQAERPLAVLAGDLLTLARTAPHSLREPLAAGAREARTKVAYARESQLWSLMAPPPPQLRGVGAGWPSV